MMSILVRRSGWAGALLMFSFVSAAAYGDENDRVPVDSVSLSDQQIIIEDFSAYSYFQQAEGSLEAGEKNQAINLYEEGLEALSQHYGLFSTLLIKPAIRLGNLYMDSGEYQLAFDTFQKAQNIIQRHEGIDAHSQIEVVDLMMIASLHVRQSVSQADKLNEFSYLIAQRNYGEDSPELVPHMIKRADWLVGTSRFVERYEETTVRSSIHKAKELYERALRIVDQAGLQGSWKRDIYQKLSYVERLQGRKGAIAYMRGAMEAVLADSQFDNAERWAARRDYADILTLFGQENEASEAYQQAWTAALNEGFIPPETATVGLLGPKSAAHVVNDYYRAVRVHQMSPIAINAVQQRIGSPIPLCSQQVMSMAGFHQDLSQYHADVSLTVRSSGDAENVEIKNSDALPARLMGYFKRVVHSIRFRPKLVKGQPTDSKIEFRQTFGVEESRNKPALTMDWQGGMISHEGCKELRGKVPPQRVPPEFRVPAFR